MYEMKANGLGCTFHMPPALQSRVIAGKEVAHGLPPAKHVEAYAVDEYPACPKNWMNGSAKAGSYFVGVKEGWGMWLDLNNCAHHTHHVAAVISIQGVNPITGLPQNKLSLEQFNKKCPKHKVAFKQDRYCPECKYKWPKQNYLATTGTPAGLFWLDGFRDENGVVRQYIITEEKIRGIAAQTIGEDRVFAIGIAFFLSKTEKPKTATHAPRSSYLVGSAGFGPALASSGHDWLNTPIGSNDDGMGVKYGESLTKGGGTWNATNSLDTPKGMSAGPLLSASAPKKATRHAAVNAAVRLRKSELTSSPQGFDSVDGFSDFDSNVRGLDDTPMMGLVDDDPVLDAGADVAEVETTKLEIGAGAKIDQQIYNDPEKLSFWQDEPEAMLYINYVKESELQRILKAGKREEKEGGFLNGLKVGN